jgi:flagellar M-ring protein FliF
MESARAMLNNLNSRGRLVLAGTVLGVLLLSLVMVKVASRPSYSTLLTGLNPADTGKVTGALDQKGIRYELQNNGTALAVESGKTANARIVLAENGLPGHSEPGFELFDKQKLGTSDFQQKVNYQRALEGELSRTIEQIDGVGSAQVQLVLPEDRLFENDQSSASAAVLLGAGSGALDPGAVRGIAQLTASSVKGLKAQNVTITSATGEVLWPNGETGADGAAGESTVQGAQTRYEHSLESELGALIDRTLGPGKAQANASATLNVDRTTEEKLTYAKKGVPLHAQTEEEKLKGGGAGAGRAAGTVGNTGAGAAAGAGGAGSNYTRTTTDTDYGVNKTVTKTEVAPGQVTRLHVGLLVDKSVPKADAAALQQAVTAAAGIDAARGDTVTMSQVTFAKQPKAAAPSPVGGYLGYAKWLGLLVAVGAFLFFVSRHLRRSEQEQLPEPAWLRELNLAPTRQLNVSVDEPVGPVVERNHGPDIVDIAGREPERIAQQVRVWMQES